MSCWACGCCAGCRPRYARLVDSIYPAYPEDGLVKSNMEKLTFYAISHPEKLDRIGEHLAARLSRDVYRARYLYMVLAFHMGPVFLCFESTKGHGF